MFLLIKIKLNLEDTIILRDISSMETIKQLMLKIKN